jgi:peptidoglycan DL-endopeptidase LytF
MYWFITQTKQRAIFSIAIMVLLHGCATEPYSPDKYYQQAQSYSTETTTSSSHLVQRGETLGSIAKLYGINYKTIAVLNGLSSPYTIYPGQRLTISSYGTTPEYQGSQSIAVDLPSAPRAQPLKSYKPSRSRTTTSRSRKTRSSSSGSHIVQRGETLYGIAISYGKNFKQVAAWNNIPPPYTLSVGQRLRLNGSGSSKPKRSKPSSYSPKRSKPSSYSPKRGATSHTVRSGETLSDVAKIYGYRLEELANWNGLAPPYEIYAGRRLRVAPYPSSPPSSSSLKNKSGSVSHTVQRGETLSDIAQRYGYSFAELANWNGIAPPYSLSVGRKLRVAPWTPQKTQKKTKTRTTGATTRTTGRSTSSHTVAQGDTLYSVARGYGVDVAELARWNNLQPPYTLSVGQRLRVKSGGTRKTPAKKSQANQNTPRHNTGYHTVVRGESLYSIATNYGYSVAQIAAWNNLQTPYRLSVGQTLRVYPPSGARLGRYKNYSTQKTKTNSTSRQKKKTNSSSRASGGYHTVVKGDTVYNIARRYGKKPANIMAWNNLQPPYNLSVGQRLRVSSSASKSRTSTRRRSSKTRKHIVKSGDTLMSIASQYGISAYNLSQWNGIGPPYTLYPGQPIWLVKPH